MWFFIDIVVNMHVLMALLLPMIFVLELQAETDRIANEIHRKKEKEKQEFQEEKAKMVTIIISMQELDCIEIDFSP